MARGSRSRRREPMPSEVFSGPLTLTLPRPVVFAQPDDLLAVQDWRRYDPRPVTSRPAKTFSGSDAQVRVGRGSKQARNRVPKSLGFVAPEKVVVCVRRKTRKEVLHALGYTGRGSGGGRKHRNHYSKVHC